MNDSTFLGTLSLPGQDHSTHQKLQVFVTGFKFLFCFDNKKNNEQSKLSFSVSSVNDNNDMVSLISIAILFLVIAFSQIN